MQTKLTLRLEESLIVRAKAWARQRGISLSQAIPRVECRGPLECSSAIPPPRRSCGTPAPRRPA
jgi:hypothetical protein